MLGAVRFDYHNFIETIGIYFFSTIDKRLNLGSAAAGARWWHAFNLSLNFSMQVDRGQLSEHSINNIPCITKW